MKKERILRSRLLTPHVCGVKAPSARLEHATYCSASKRSNPLSYEGILQARILIHNQGLVKDGISSDMC